MRRWDYIGHLVQDVRYAVRTLARSPGFTAAAVLTLAIGLTGTISMFTLINGVLLSPLPVRAEDELLVGWRGLPGVGARRWPFTTADLDLVRRESRQFASVAGVGYNDPVALALSDDGESAMLRASRVTGEFFDVLGVEPLLGRPLGPDDDLAGSENVVVLAHGLWQTRYGASRDVLGRRITIGGQRFTIVGVMPQDVEHPRRVEAWMSVSAMQTTTTNPTARFAMATELDMLARVRPSVTAAQAREELRALGPAIDALRPGSDARGLVPSLQPYREFVVGDVRSPMLILFAAVGLVLLIACANVSSLLLVRSDARRSEFAVRAALGAGRGRLVRQLLVEGLVLACAGTAVAVVAATIVTPVLLRWVPDGLPRPETIRVDARVVSVSVILTLAVAVLASLLPALTSVGRQLADNLRSGGRGATAGNVRWRRALVAGQVAVAVVGLAGASLLVGSLRQLRAEAARLATDQLVYVPLNLPQTKYSDRPRLRRFVTDLARALEADDRVLGATPINATPFSGTGWDVVGFTAEGQSQDEAATNPPLNFEEIHPRYFDTFRVALLRGRAFTDDDREGASKVTIVSSDVAARVWPGQDALGKRLKLGGPASTGPWLTVVGVTAPTRYRDLRIERATLYLPAAQMLGAAERLAVRTAMPVSVLADLVRARVRSLDPDVQVMPLRAFSQLLEVPLARPRFYTVLMTTFGATGVALAGVGLYGVVAASVRQRRREFGVRMALGAEGRHVRRLVMVDGAWLVGAGVVVGLAVALLATEALRGLLYGVQPLDPWALGASVLGILAVSAAALAVPLRAAGRVEPAEVLRSE